MLFRSDSDNGEKVIQEVYKSDQIFHGNQTGQAADLQLAFRPGYRTSWETTLGAAPAGTLVANLKKWSGDHCASDPSDTQGILLCNRKLSNSKISILDIAPTALKHFGISISAEIDGRAVDLLTQ